MNFLISNAYAQGAPAPAGGGMGQIVILVAFAAIFYFMLIRPQQKRMKEQRDMLAKLTSGDEVVTGGGLIGRIVEVGETLVTLEIATGVNVRVQRGQITQLLPKGTLKNG
jgi:preprotein translocase subunit YajC